MCFLYHYSYFRWLNEKLCIRHWTPQQHDVHLHKREVEECDVAVERLEQEALEEQRVLVLRRRLVVLPRGQLLSHVPVDLRLRGNSSNLTVS